MAHKKIIQLLTYTWHTYTHITQKSTLLNTHKYIHHSGHCLLNSQPRIEWSRHVRWLYLWFSVHLRPRRYIYVSLPLRARWILMNLSRPSGHAVSTLELVSKKSYKRISRSRTTTTITQPHIHKTENWQPWPVYTDHTCHTLQHNVHCHTYITTVPVQSRLC